MDAVLNEICRASGEIRPYVLKRWANHLRAVIQPQLDELAAIKRAERLAQLQAKARKRRGEAA